MSEVKNKCQLENCSRAASTRCFCCNRNVCTRHFSEHIEAVKAQIDPLVNDVNSVMERLQGLTVEKITEPSFAELHQWRVKMYQLIDEVFLTKIKELETLIETNTPEFVEYKKQQSQTLMKIQDEVRQLAEDGDATLEQIQLLGNQLNNVEVSLNIFQRDFCSVNTNVFAQGLVTVTSNLKKTAASTCKERRRTQARQQQHQAAGLKPSNPTVTPSPFGFRAATTVAPSTPIFSTPIIATPCVAHTTSSSASTFTGIQPFSFGTTPTTCSSSTSLFGTSTTTSAPSFGSFGKMPTFSVAPSTPSTTRPASSSTPGFTFNLFGSSTAFVPQPNEQTSSFGTTEGFPFNKAGQK